MFPLAFVAGVHGFALFAPYLIAITFVGLLIRRPRAQVVRVTEPFPSARTSAPLLDVPIPAGA